MLATSHSFLRPTSHLFCVLASFRITHQPFSAFESIQLYETVVVACLVQESWNPLLRSRPFRAELGPTISSNDTSFHRSGLHFEAEAGFGEIAARAALLATIMAAIEHDTVTDNYQQQLIKQF